MPLDGLEGLLHEPTGRFEVTAAAQHPGLLLQDPGQAGGIIEGFEKPAGEVEVGERVRVLAGRVLQPSQVAEAAGLLPGVAEPEKDRQGRRVGLAGVFQPAELPVDGAEGGLRDGPSAAFGCAQRQGLLERPECLAGPAGVFGKQPQGIQRDGFAAAVLGLAEERESLMEPLAGRIRLSEVPVEIALVEQGQGLPARTVFRSPKG